MNTYIMNLIKKTLFIGLLGILVSCDDFLDKVPPSYIVPSDYYRTEDQVQACANKFYSDIFPYHSGSYGTFQIDGQTDNQANRDATSRFTTGQWRVGMTNDNWTWTYIREINYQLNAILGRYDKQEISGSDRNIRHYIGEIYFFRAYRYFWLLQQWGDLPIVEVALPDIEDVLVENNQRMPRNEVARFILSDLDKAIELMSENFDARRTRISIDAALLMKSRVALFEGSWLTNFKGTPFVPNGEGWPGKAKPYNANYQFPAGNIDQEAAWFFGVAAVAAEKVAEKYKGMLSKNTGLVPQKADDPVNPYLELFGNINMLPLSEVILWREYSEGLNILNNVEAAVQRGNMGTGLTRGLIESFLMEDGKPIYASDYTYSDITIADVRKNRDPRLFVFLKEPGQINYFKNENSLLGGQAVRIEPYPDITNGANDFVYITGYALRKGGTFDKALADNSKGYTASITFRATEALLNYMEAQYMLTKDLNAGRIREYWKTVRECAGFKNNAIDPLTTIAATDMSKEQLDWGAFTAGRLLDDPVLYNIRRERRCELMAEGLRWMDIIRWRSLDQLKHTRYHIEGFHLWNTPMQSWYTNLNSGGSSSANVSSPSLSEYLRPYEKNMTSGNLYREGYTWSMAHYLQPLPLRQFLLTSSDNASFELSPLYQNPYWPMVADASAIE